MLVLFNSVADIKWLSAMNMLKVFSHVKSYAIKHLARSVVNKFKFNMFKLTPHEFTCAIVKNSFCAENRLIVARSKRIEFFER